MYTPLLENPTDPAKRDIPWNKFKQLYLYLLVLLLIIHKTHFLSSRKVHIIERVVTLSCKTRHVVENENVLEGRFKDLVKSPEKWSTPFWNEIKSHLRYHNMKSLEWL